MEISGFIEVVLISLYFLIGRVIYTQGYQALCQVTASEFVYRSANVMRNPTTLPKFSRKWQL